MNAWAPIIFFDGESESDLREEFIQLSAKHGGNFTAVDVARHVFKDLKEPELRAVQAASVWGRDLGVQEAIRVAMLLGAKNGEDDDEVRILRQIAENAHASDKDRIAAVMGIAAIKGKIQKPQDMKITFPGAGSSGLPTFRIERYDD